MKVFDGIESVDPTLRGAVLTVGNFDGVHLGHQRILRTARALARRASTAVMAMTFEPHPLALLRPQQTPEQLTPWDEKVHQLERAGADAVVRLATDRPLLSLSAEDFVWEILVKHISPSYIVEGHNFGFGRDRAGNVETLERCSAAGGFQVHIVEPYRIDLGDGQQTVLSSTIVRRCLGDGEVAHAAACLGRPYCLIGRVIHGAGDGRKLGYPTINLDAGRQMIPAEGVYAGRAAFGDIHRPAAVSIGQRPTLGGDALVVEAYLLDESGDWYGRNVRLYLLDRLRAQKKFESRQTLTEQISSDIEAVRRVTRSETCSHPDPQPKV